LGASEVVGCWAESLTQTTKKIAGNPDRRTEIRDPRKRPHLKGNANQTRRREEEEENEQQRKKENQETKIWKSERHRL
jgi:hypothetical protein